jgi:glycosyltransferase involved in cell wall biosynthesis
MRTSLIPSGLPDQGSPGGSLDVCKNMHGTEPGLEAAETGILARFAQRERPEGGAAVRWTVVIPVFNEARFIAGTLQALARQSRRFRLVVVDNGSMDGSVGLMARLIDELALDGRILFEPRPGPVHALARGIAELDTQFVATCDADTHYPPDYLARAERLLDARPDASVACAWFLPPGGSRLRGLLAKLHQLGAAALLPLQAHNGGAGQCFRTDALAAAGGYGDHVWPWVLADHEIIQRMLKQGPALWHRDHACAPSDRRRNADAVRWSLAERLLYHVTPFRLKDWYFHDFLAPRLAARGLHCVSLRDRNWSSPDDEPADALCG